jgi:hypothetical protein
MGAREASAAPRTGAILPARRAEAAICHKAQSINYDNVREIRRSARPRDLVRADRRLARSG